LLIFSNEWKTKGDAVQLELKLWLGRAFMLHGSSWNLQGNEKVVQLSIKMFACNKCNTKLSRKDVLIRHKINCCKCRKCFPALEFSKPEELHRHTEEAHRKDLREFVCVKCGKNFSRRYGLIRHEATCSKFKSWFPKKEFQSCKNFEKRMAETNLKNVGLKGARTDSAARLAFILNW